MADRIQIRRDTAANWALANPVLAIGELGFETDTLKLKIGSGTETWNTLSYVLDATAYATPADVTAAIDALVDSAPGTLDTLNELAASLGDDANFASTVTTALAAKANSADLATVATSGAYADVTGTPTLATVATTGVYSDLTGTPTLATVATTGAYSDLTGTPTLPSALTDLSIVDGTAGQVLSADGDGTYTFIDAAVGGSFEAVASGSLSDGSTVVLNADGTVSVAASDIATALAGSSVQMTTGNIGSPSCAVIPGGRIVVAYRDYNNNNYGTAVIGTISGTTITFGTPVVFYSSGWTTPSSTVYHAALNKIVIFGQGQYGWGQGRVADIVGDTLSFGPEYAYVQSSASSVSAAYDSASEKIVLAFLNNNSNYYNTSTLVVTVGSNNSLSYGAITGVFGRSDKLKVAFSSTPSKFIVYGYDGSGGAKAKVGNVSGTSLTYGSTTDLPSSTYSANLDAIYDSNADKFVFVFTQDGYPKAVVGTVSENSISFGTVVSVDNVITQHISLAYDTSTNKTIFVARANSVQELREITLIGNVPNISDPIPFAGGSDGTLNTSVYDPVTNRVAIIYSLTQTLGHAVVYRPAGIVGVSNLTAENYAGIADGVYADGATATIQTAGSVDDAQSGLIPGQAYYVQDDGTLSTSPGTPSVFAGTAVSSTKLLIGKEAPASTVAYADVTGTPDLSSYATETYVDTAVSNLVDTAPDALNTLNELAAALNDDANFAGTVTTSLAAKANTADLATVATSGSYNDLTDQPAGGGSFEAVASGEISVGDPVIVNPDGSVTVVRVDESLVIGGFTTYETSADVASVASSYTPDMAYDALSDKIVMLLREKNPSTTRYEYLEARVLSVTDGVISDISGQHRVSTAPAGDGSQIMDPQITADGNGKFLICWHARSGNSTNSNMLFLKARVATVSGTSLSFGVETNIESDDGVNEPLTAFVPDVNKFVIFYSAYNTSTPGEVARYVKTATISGTSVSFGVPLQITTGFPNYNHYSYIGNSKIATISANNTLIIYEVSGTSVVRRVTTSIESAFVPPSTDVDFACIGYDPNSGKGIIFVAGEYSGYTDTPSGGFNQVFTVTVSSSNVVTYGTPTEVVDANGNRFVRGWNPHIAFNTSSNIFLIGLYGAGWPSGSGQYAFTAKINNDDVNVTIPVQTSGGGSYLGVVYAEHENIFVLQNDSKQVYTAVYDAVTNLTAENYAGIADAAYADAATATIQTAGSVDDAQSGLTPGQAYYVQANGTLGLTPGTPSVFAGTAVSATSLLIGKEAPASTVAYADVTGTPDLSSYATEAYVTTAVSNLVDTAPEALNTLNELAAALGDDANFAGTVTTSLAAKANTADLATVATSGSYNDLTDQPAGGGSFQAVASGSLSDGSTSILNADGTVSAVAQEVTASLLHTLNNPNAYGTSADDRFGYSVSVSGNYAIVGAYQEDDAGGLSSGKAYIFNVTTGALLHTLDNPNPYSTSVDDRFGQSVAISGNYAIVAASYEDDAGGIQSGKAYIYNVTTGALLHTLDNPNAYGTSASDGFGWSVAISGDYAIVGVVFEDDAGGVESGKAYIYNVTTGALVHTLDNPTAYSTSANDFFGLSVAISGNYAIVGARDEDDAGGYESGKAYIFDVTTGALLHTLDNPNAYDTSASDAFGTSVAVSGDYAIVGAQYEDDAGGTSSGKAYIFDVTTGALLHTLDNPNPYGTSVSDTFGFSVAISGNYAVVSARLEDDAGGDQSGKAYIFDVTTGALVHTYDNPNAYSTSADDYFGFSVAISGNYAIVGAYGEDDAGGTTSGKAYIYSVPTTTTNLTAENYAGIADAAYADAATATIQTAGSVDDAQSGLTPGQAYYVQPNGTLGLTPGTPSVFAGTAVSSTKLLIGKEAPAADLSSYATEAYVTTAVSNLVDTAPEALNTLNELAAALGDDANFAGTVTTSLSTKLGTDSVIDGGTV